MLDQADLPADLLSYTWASVGGVPERVIQVPGTVVFVSTARTRIEAEERAFAQAVARATPSSVHLALWIPFHVADLPVPALVTFRLSGDVFAGGSGGAG